MAKIRVSTIRQMADVQVINVNARLVSKATRASVMLRSILDRFAMVEQTLKTDANGKVIVDVDGPIPENRLSFTHIIGENPCAGIEAVEVCTSVCEFLDELVAAFEDDEKEDKKKD